MQFRQSVFQALALTGLLTMGVTGMACAQNGAAPKPGSPGEKQTPPTTANSGPIALTIKTDKAAYAVADPINITLTAKNTTKAPLSVQFNSGQKYDIEIHKGKDRNGELVWKWSQGHMFAQMITSATLSPDKPLVYTVVFNPNGKQADGKSVQLAPGSYTLVGILTTFGRTPRPMASTTIQIK